MVFEIRQTIEKKLQSVNKRIDTLMTHAKGLLEQREKLENAIKLVEDAGRNVDPSLRRKLAALEKEINDISLKSVRAERACKTLAKPAYVPKTPSDKKSDRSPTPKTKCPESPMKPFNSFLNQRPQQTLEQDLRLATELGQGLLNEVRRLQALLVEREEFIKTIMLEKALLQGQMGHTDYLIRSLDDGHLRLLGEKRALELVNQEMQIHIGEQQKTENALKNQTTRLLQERDSTAKEAAKEVEMWRTRNNTLLQELKYEHQNHQNETALLRKDLFMRQHELRTLKKVEVTED